MKLSWLLFCSTVLTSVAMSQSSPEAVAEAEIRQSIANWVKAANSNDWQTALKVWAPDLIGWFPGTPEITYSREVENASQPPKNKTTYEVTINEVIVSGDMAVARDTWKFTTTAGEGTKPQTITARSFEVWRRQPDRAWKISRWITAPEPATKS